MKCAVCGLDCEMVQHHFPTRAAPHNQPFVHACYFDDPFFGGEGAPLCSAMCSWKWSFRKLAMSLAKIGVLKADRWADGHLPPAWWQP